MEHQSGKFLTLKGLSKQFPGVLALDNVSFEISRGTIHGICGENGAGKSTLIKILAGVYPHQSYEGVVEMEGETLKFDNVHQSIDGGVSVVYQELELVNQLTVAENIYLGVEPLYGPIIDWRKLFSDTHSLLNEYNLAINPNDRVADLGVGQKQMVEIAKALSKQAKLLVLDEPSSALSLKETEQLHTILRTVRSRGVTCIYITHHLQEFFDLTDEVTVLRDGQFIETHSADDLTMNKLISLMVGRPMTKRFPEAKRAPGDVVLSVKDLEIGDRHDEHLRYVKRANFELRSGEVLGIAGLMGSGRTELAHGLIGELGQVRGGEVAIAGQSLVIKSADEAMSAGMFLVPEDRKEHGLVLIQSILHNISLPNLDQLASFMRIDTQQELSEANKYKDDMSIKAPNILTTVNNLSGGNQQKVVLAKTLMSVPKVLILDDPTRGIDVGAKFEIYNLINRLTAAGVAVIMISSELEEVIGMSDRIMVVHDYTTVCILGKEDFDLETIMSYATGVRTGARNE